MPNISQATTLGANVRWGRDVLAPASVWGAGGAVGAATGINPTTEAVKFQLLNPMDSASLLFLSNPFQRIGADGRYGLSRLGLFGYKTLVAGVGPGGWKRNLTAGNLILSSIQGTARGINNVLNIGDGKLSTALRHARTVGLAGLVKPSSVVYDIKSRARVLEGSLKYGSQSQIRSALSANQVKSRTVLRHVAAAGVVTAKDLDSAVLRAAIQIESTGKGTSRVIIPRLSETVTPKGIHTGVYKTGGWGPAFKVGATRAVLRAASAYTYLSIGAAILKPVVGSAVTGVSNLAVSAIEILRSISSRELTPAQIPNVFLSAEASTERQRAIQAIYSAKINPNNRFLGNEAQMYHA